MQISSLMWDFDHKSLPSELVIKFAKISSVHNNMEAFTAKMLDQLTMVLNHSVTKAQKFIMN